MTAQMGERIFYRGKEHVLFACPLGGYADADHPLPQFTSPHTANWRGYVATCWSIRTGWKTRATSGATTCACARPCSC
jgi:hypothetical protein